MGKPMVAYAILVSHTKPIKSNNVTFLNVYHIKSDGDIETLRKAFMKAFAEDHPNWSIKKVDVGKE